MSLLESQPVRLPLPLPCRSDMRSGSLPVAGNASVAIALLLLASCAGQGPPEVADQSETVPLSLEEAEQWGKFLEPDSFESGWDEVNWRTSIWEAIHEAVETQKPLLLFSMNGHPKGFT